MAPRWLASLSPYRLLELPLVYSTAQHILVPGFAGPFVAKIRAVSAGLPAGERVLDVGCGPTSWLPRIGIHPVGLDLSAAYTAALRGGGTPAVRGSATALPFGDRSLHGVWCLAMLHHLGDDEVRGALREMARVCRPGGYVVVWDAVLPDRAWRRPIAWAIRKLDRGGRIRSAPAFLALFDPSAGWSFDHFRYTLYGLEGYVCVLKR